MSEFILDATNIDTSVITFGAPKPHPSGSKVVNVNHRDGKRNLQIKTPMMLTWGAQESTDDKGEPNGKWSMALQFPSADYATPETSAMLEEMQKFVEFVKATATERAVQWFGMKETTDPAQLAIRPHLVAEKFSNMLRYPKVKGTSEIDYDRPPTMSVKFPRWNGVWKCDVFDEVGNPLFVAGKVNSHLSPLEYLMERTNVICLLEASGIWIAPKQVSITWNVRQVVVHPPKQHLQPGLCLLVPTSGDVDKFRSQPETEPRVMDPPDEKEDDSAMLVDDDEDENMAYRAKDDGPMDEVPAIGATHEASEPSTAEVAAAAGAAVAAAPVQPESAPAGEAVKPVAAKKVVKKVVKKKIASPA